MDFWFSLEWIYGFLQFRKSDFNSWRLCKSGHRNNRQESKCGKIFRWETWILPSLFFSIVTHFELEFELCKIKLNSWTAPCPFSFFNFFKNGCLAFCAQFSPSSFCFHLLIGLILEWLGRTYYKNSLERYFTNNSGY